MSPTGPTGQPRPSAAAPSGDGGFVPWSGESIHLCAKHSTSPRSRQSVGEVGLRHKSMRLPLIPECLILHHADDLDAKLEMYTRCLRHDQEPGPFTVRDPVLGKQLFKGRTV